jgi:outer membrane protein
VYRRWGVTPLSDALMRCAALILTGLTSSCALEPPEPQASPPDVSPVRQQTTGTLRLDSSHIRPMYRGVLSIDIETAARVASLDNVEILKSRERVEASHGQLESAAEAVLPVIGPGVVLNHLQGVDINNLGMLQAAHFGTLNPAVLIQWALNPGQVYFDVIAARKRLVASEQQDRAVAMRTVRTAALQYYDLVLAQARIVVMREALAEAQEFSRLATRRYDAQTGLFVDVTRGQAILAAREQDLATALNGFYKASVVLGSTLYLDPTVTLVPKTSELAPRDLVRNDLGIDQMLAIAVQWRPDLQGVNTLIAAADADTKALIWGIGTPNLQASYQAGKFGSKTPSEQYPLQNQEVSIASVGWVFNPTVFGQIKTSDATAKIAVLEGKRLLEQVKAEVVTSLQDSATNAQLIPLAQKQVKSTQEALRVTQENFENGVGLFLDVLQAEDAVDQARLNHANAITGYNQAQVNLLAALGLIDQANVGWHSRQKAAKR